MQDFRKLVVWQEAHHFALAAYRATASFPGGERFGLISQIRRASVSIAANIAEGCGRDTTAELLRFLHMSMGSASEVEYYLLLSHDLELLSAQTHMELEHQLVRVKKMLNTFIQKLKASKQ